jgi:hypothetical protein
VARRFCWQLQSFPNNFAAKSSCTVCCSRRINRILFSRTAKNFGSCEQLEWIVFSPAQRIFGVYKQKQLKLAEFDSAEFANKSHSFISPKSWATIL